MRKTFLSAVAIASMLYANESNLETMHIIENNDDTLAHLPGSATIITAEQILQTQPLSTQDMLRRTPGIHAVETDGYGFYPRITIRGIGSDMSKKVLLLEDGAPIALGPYTDPAAYYTPPVERMERIEILKGSGSLAHGPSTIGGAINYITKAAPPTPQGNVVLMAGERNYFSQLLEYGGTWNENSANISMLHKSGAGWRNMPFDVKDVVIKASTVLGEDHVVGFKVTYYDQEAAHTYLGLSAREYEENYKQNRAKNDRMYIERVSLDLNHAIDLGGGMTWKNLLFYNNASRDWWREGFSLDQESGYNVMSGRSDGRLRSFDVMGIDSRITLPFKLAGMNNRVDAGVRYHVEEMRNRRLESSDNTHAVDTSRNNANAINGVREDDLREANALAFFLQYQIDFNQGTTLTPGVRMEHYTQKRDIHIWTGKLLDVSNSTNNTVFIPGLGVTHTFSKKLTLFAGVHQGYAPPRVADAISNSGDAVELEAERSTNYEVGMRSKFGGGYVEMTYFRLDFENQLVQATQSGGAGTMLTNAGRTLNEGLELGGEMVLGGGFGVSGNYTYLPTAKLNSTRILGGEDRNGNRLTYAPRHLLNLRVDYQTGLWGGNIGYSYVSDQYADLENTKTQSADGKKGLIDAYGIWDLNLWLHATPDVRIFGSAKNLTDERYIAARAPEGIMSGIGRTINLGVGITF